MLSRGFKNNNPGNLIITDIKWQGKVPVSKNTDGKFEQFIDLKSGVRAMIIDVAGDITRGANTLRKLVTQYAPPIENNTKAYIQFVSNKTGIAPDAKITLTKTVLESIIKAKILLENGTEIADSIFEEAYNLVPLSTKKKFQLIQ